MKLPKLRLLVATIAILSVFTVPVAADHRDDVQCPDDQEFNYASISYDDVSTWELWYDAWQYADISIEKCGLDGRETLEVAGEIRAHVIGQYFRSVADPGPTIDMGETGHDLQEDEYEFLMYVETPFDVIDNFHDSFLEIHEDTTS